MPICLLLVADSQLTPLHVIGDAASIAGLVVSVVVLAVSRKARDAALEAAHEVRRSLFRKFLASDLRNCADDLDLINSMWNERRQRSARVISHLLAHRLLRRLTRLSTQTGPHLDNETILSFQKITHECGLLVAELRKSIQELPPDRELAVVPDALANLSGLIDSEVGRYNLD